VQCSAVQCSAMQCSAMQCSAAAAQVGGVAASDALRAHPAVRLPGCARGRAGAAEPAQPALVRAHSGTVCTQCNAMQCNAMQCNAMQCNAMQCRTRPGGNVPCRTAACLPGLISVGALCAGLCDTSRRSSLRNRFLSHTPRSCTVTPISLLCVVAPAHACMRGSCVVAGAAAPDGPVPCVCAVHRRADGQPRALPRAHP
jgi:hypothetical protein